MSEVAGATEVGVAVRTASLLDELPADRGGAVWRLSGTVRQLDANLVRVPPGARVADHVEPDLDVLLCVVGGSGRLETRSGAQQLAAGCVVWLPRGVHRAVSADSDGLLYMSVHCRRPGLSIRTAVKAEWAGRAEREEGTGSEGGEAACMLNRLCVACDRPAVEADARYCTGCGSELPRT